MQISETTKRECCEAMQDLRPYRAEFPEIPRHLDPHFCKHCGQIWIWRRACGDMSATWHEYRPGKNDA